MNNRLILLLAASIPVAAASQVNSAGAPGDLMRGREFVAAADYRAALDRLDRIDFSLLGFDQRQQARFLKAEALYGLGRYGSARTEFESYLAEYPFAADRGPAMKRVADCMYGAGDYAEALKVYQDVDVRSLSGDAAAEMCYRRGFCAMKEGMDRVARASFEAAGTPAARFYLGVMDYDAGDYASARKYFASVDASKTPGDMADYYLASIELADGNYEKAASAAQGMMRRKKLDTASEAEMNRVAGEALYLSGDRSTGMDYIRRYLAAVETPAPTAAYIAGVDSYENGRYDEAVDLLGRVTGSADAAMAQTAYLYVGQALHHRGDIDAALLAFDKATKIDGGDAAVREAAYYNYAAARFGGGTIPFGSSAKTFEKFLQLYPDGPYSDRVRQYLVEGYMADNDYEAALERVEAIRNPGRKALAARQRILYVFASQSMASGDYGKADSYLAKAEAISGADDALAAEVTLLQAQSMAAKGRDKEAAEKYRAYITATRGRGVNDAVANYGLGYALLATDDFDGAKKAFSQISGNKSFNQRQRADVLNRLADIEYYGRRFAEASALYGKAYAEEPASGDYASFNMARMKGYMRDYKGKLAALKEFMGEFPSSVLIPDALLETTQAQINLGRSNDAITTYTRLVEEYPGTAQGRQGYLQMAMTLLDMGRRDEAVDAYRKVISLFPTSEEAAQASTILKNIYADQNRGDEYLEFMASVDNAPKVSDDDTERLTYDAAMAAMNDKGQSARLEEFVQKYPDSKRTPEALRLLAEADYAAGRIPEALARWQTLVAKASTSEMATAARLGTMRAARDMGDYAVALEAADAVLASSAAAAARNEATFTRAVALEADGREAEALPLWQSLADNTSDIFGAKSAFRAAEALFEAGRADEALAAVQKFTASGSPHRYWVARGFILMSDIYKSQGKNFEAREYLEALRDNYPGDETDIQSMLESRLSEEK